MVELRPIREGDIAGFNAAVDRVAREKRFLARTEGPPMEQSRAFVLSNLEKGNPHFVAVEDAAVVGWCDIIRKDDQPMFQHSGTLGMGLVAEHRGRGLGRRLIETTVQAALAAGLARIDLVVRADNEPAIRLYQRVGFEFEGFHRRTDFIDGIFYDTHTMAIVV